VPNQLMLPIAEATSFFMTRFRPKAPQLLTPGAIRRLSLMRHADTSKAKNELGFVPTSIENAFADAYAFHWARGGITNDSARAPQPAASTVASVPHVTIHA
jgi:nucleoside-diphosphate-sugar epimerase